VGVVISLERFGTIVVDGYGVFVVVVRLNAVLIWWPMALGITVFEVMSTIILVTSVAVTCIVAVVSVGVKKYLEVAIFLASKRVDNTLMRFFLITGVGIERFETILVAETVVLRGWGFEGEGPAAMNML
jgi:hypothetical protein